MDTVQNEVTGDGVLIIWDPVSLSMENKTMQRIFEEGPEHHTSSEHRASLIEGGHSQRQEVVHKWQCCDWGHPIWALSDKLDERVVEKLNCSPWGDQQFWFFQILNILCESPFCPHQLPPHSFGGIKLIFLLQLRAESILWDVLGSIQLSDLWKLSHHLVCGSGVVNLFENGINIFSKEGLDSVSTTWMVVYVLCDVINITLEDNEQLLGSLGLFREVILPEFVFVFEVEELVTDDVF